MALEYTAARRCVKQTRETGPQVLSIINGSTTPRGLRAGGWSRGLWR